MKPLEALAEIPDEGWLVGGAVRDRLLERPTIDYDVAVRGDPRTLARGLARATHGHVFKLSEGFGAWRVVARDHSWQVDLVPLVGATIEADLANRDLTINAIAEPLAGGVHVDPFGGIRDLRARRLRMVSEQAFVEDPLRSVRVARFACELDFKPDRATAAAAGASAPALAMVSPERIWGELKRIIASDRAPYGLQQLETLGVIDVVLPELAALRGVDQSSYHHLDVYRHTRAVLDATLEVTDEPERWFGALGEPLRAVLSEPLAEDLTRGQAIRLGALFHDVAKPATRRVTDEGRVTFIGHDALGAEMATAMLMRLHSSQRLAEFVAGLTRHHLRLGFLVHEMPLDRREVYRYLRACEPVEVEVTVLSVADRLATRGRKASAAAIERHLELARAVLGDALAWRARRPRPPVGGDELVRALRLVPGPEVGRILETLEEESFAGALTSREDAIARARQLVGDQLVRDREP